jgi:hypothetical protein
MKDETLNSGAYWNAARPTGSLYLPTRAHPPPTYPIDFMEIPNAKSFDIFNIRTCPQTCPVRGPGLQEIGINPVFCRPRALTRITSSYALWQNLVLLFAAFVTFSATAQIQQAWVAHYNNGITNGTNQAVKMALDTGGNIYVTGFSQNTNLQLGYVTIKYASNGNQLWATRYDSTSYQAATPAAMIVDSSNDVIVTGNALTIKYDPNGNVLWTAPYAGTALAVDSNANVYVGGFSSNFATVKIAPQGTNVWSTYYVETYGPTVSQAILIDTVSNVYVSGLDSYASLNDPPMYNNAVFVQLTTIKYGPSGNQIWKASQAPEPQFSNVQIGGAALDNSNNLYLVADWLVGASSYGGYFTYKYSNNGMLLWTANPASGDIYNKAHVLMVNNVGSLLMTGVIYGGSYYAPPIISYGTLELNPNGAIVWSNLYPQGSSATSVGTALAIDSANNSYVTGYSPGTNSLRDIVTIKYGPNGNQVWLQRYNGPGNGNDAGNAIAVDNNGNVYVAGYDTTTAGGTEMVLIKYSPLVLQKQPNGTVLLQAQGYAGENFNIQASEDLFHWLDLGSATADTNGLMQFDDTNAANYPARFYYTNPQ